MLFEADTAGATIVRDGGQREIAILLPASATRLMGASSIVVFDFIRIADSIQHPIPGRVQWPVLPTVTRDVE